MFTEPLQTHYNSNRIQLFPSHAFVKQSREGWVPKIATGKKIGWHDVLFNCFSQEASQAGGSPLELVSIKYIIQNDSGLTSVCVCKSSLVIPSKCFCFYTCIRSAATHAGKKKHLVQDFREQGHGKCTDQIQGISCCMMQRWRWLHTSSRQPLWKLPYKAAAKYQAQDEDEYPGPEDDYVNIQN